MNRAILHGTMAEFYAFQAGRAVTWRDEFIHQARKARSAGNREGVSAYVRAGRAMNRMLLRDLCSFRHSKGVSHE